MQGAELIIALKLAFRARLTSMLVWITLALILAVLLSAQFSGRQPATVALDVGLSVIRLALPLVIVFLAQEFFSREFDRRYFLTSLSYPRPRWQFLLGRFFGMLGIVLATLAFLGALLALLVGFVGQGYDQATPVALGTPYITTLGFIGQDLLVIAAIATLLGIVAITPSFVLIGTFGFLLVARSYAGIIDLLENERYVVDNPELYQSSLGILRYLLPDLGALDVRRIALYNHWEFLPEQWLMLLITSLTYALALLAISAWLLNRKQFS